MNRFFVVIIILLVSCSLKEKKIEKPLDIFSYHQGYLFQEQNKIFGNQYNPDQFLEGMRASLREEESSYTEEEVRNALKSLDEEFASTQKQENLKISENTLLKIAHEQDVKEVIPTKLYYRILKEGKNEPVNETHLIEATYRVFVIQKQKEKEIFSHKNAVKISIADTLPGFSKGVIGLKVREKRKIYIHPELGYGEAGGKIGPNQLLIIELELISCECL